MNQLSERTTVSQSKHNKASSNIDGEFDTIPHTGRNIKSKLTKVKPHSSLKDDSEVGFRPSPSLRDQKRQDAYGNPITHKKKQKVTFIDRLNPNKQFSEEYQIESFKKYNAIMSYPDDFHDGLGKSTSLCSCCII